MGTLLPVPFPPAVAMLLWVDTPRTAAFSLLMSPHPEGAAAFWAGSACRERSGSVEQGSLCSLHCLWYRTLVFPASSITPVSSHC